MNVSLTPQLESLIQSKVEAGAYQSASEVVREALRLLQERDKLRELQRQELRKQIRRGLTQLDRGEGVPLTPASLKREARRARHNRV